MKLRVLVVDDDPAMCAMLETRLKSRGIEVVSTTIPAAAADLVAETSFDAVVSDVNMKGTNGLDLCRRVLDVNPNVPVVLITAFGTMDTAIMAIRAGAYDFLPKPFEIDQLVLILERGATLFRLKDEVQRLRRAVANAQSFEGLVGASPIMVSLYALLDKVARSDAPVLITGESGTGKELVARALHEKGPRAKGPFVALNCAAMTESLLESELFGYTKGAFTDAKSANSGLFLTANGGTIFLDEVGELPLGLQPKLLRALQERKVRPVGGTTEIAFDARVITATNRDLEAMVDERTFREDLFFRINVLHVALPPLRARGGDVLLLAQSFLDRISARANKKIRGFSPNAALKLVDYPWPGNVRELENSIERAVALAALDTVMVEDLAEKVRNYESTSIVLASDDPSTFVSLAEMGARYARKVLASVAGNKSAAARMLAIERKTLQRMLSRSAVGESDS